VANPIGLVARIGAVLLASGFAGSAVAEPHAEGPQAAAQQERGAEHLCRDDEPLVACFERIYDESLTALSEEAGIERSREQFDRLAAVATGTGVGNARSSLTDLIPIASLTGLLSDFGTDEDSGAFSANLNLPMLTGPDRNFQLRGTLDTSPALFPPVREALAEEVRAARSADLEESLNGLGDFGFEVTYNHASRRFGRAFGKNRALFEALFVGVLQRARAAGGDDESERLFELADTLSRALPNAEEPLVETAGELSAADRAAAERAVARAAGAVAQQQLLIEQAYAAAGLPDFYRLLNNQPQLTFTGTYHRRDALIGQDQLGFRIGLEMGLANLNGFREQAAGSCRGVDAAGGSGGADEATLAACLDGFTQYAARHSARLENGDRFSVHLSYDHLLDYTLDLPDDDVRVTVPASDTWVFGLAYGRYLSPGNADDDSRIDLAVDYESPGDDVRNERLVVSFTWTLRIADLSVPLGFVYANNDEYLDDVDTTFGAHFGVKFDLVGVLAGG
jgi:hypothetical protein